MEHQKKGVSDLSNGRILCGGVGSGKSITSLWYWYERVCVGSVGTSFSMQRPRNVLVITTAKKRNSLDWIGAAAKFGIGETLEASVENATIEVDSWHNIHKYVGREGLFIIFDEQKVVGKGAWVKSFLKLAAANEWILLSATPGDTWMDYIPVFVANGWYRNRTDFIERHVVYKHMRNYPVVSRYMGERKLSRLRDEILVEMPMVRHTTRVEIEVPVEYPSEAQNRILRDRWNIYKEEPIADIAGALACLRRALNTHPSRLAALTDVIVEKRRVIVFYNLDAELEILRGLASVEGLEVAEYNGHKHESVPTSEYWVYLVQYGAGAEAWECTSTDTIVFYSGTYSWKTLEQCRGRIDRLNTSYQKLYYYHFWSRSGLDLAIRKCLKEKRDFNLSAFRKG